MKNEIRLLAVLIGLQCISLQSAIVIENITVIDAKNEVRNGQTVFIENGLIQSIGSKYGGICFYHGESVKSGYGFHEF